MKSLAQQTVLLRDYVDVRRLYQLDVATGQFAIVDKPTGRGFEDRPWGYGQVRQLGVWRRHSIFVAAFEHDGQAWFFGEGRSLKLEPEHTVARQLSLFPLRRHFELKTANERAYEADYWFLAFETWPDDRDIFTYLVRHCSTPTRIRRFIYSWQATKAGRATGTPEFQREMDERVGRHDA